MRSSSSTAALKATTLLAFATSTTAFWRMPCMSRSGLARLDPLVNPGTISEHVHAIHGGSGFSDSATTADLLASDCTSCSVTEDKSAYWTPALYFQNAATGEFKLVTQVGGMLSYYLLYPNAGETNVTAFPEGFEMIAGDTNQRNFSYPVPDVPKSNWNVAPYNTQSFLRQAALGFNCLDYSKTPEGSLFRHFLPDKAYLDANCANGVRFELMFPSCWNGKDVTSSDKKSHVAYPSEVMTGNCPDGFGTRLPSLFFETIWNTNEFAGTDGQFVIANGDPTGCGYHGDFIMGWEESFLQSAVDTCTNPSGQIQDCPLFTIQSEADYTSCNITESNIPAAIANEDVLGAMSALPGNDPIISGGYAGGSTAGGSGAATTTAPAASIPSLSYQPGTSVASDSEYIPGAIFAAKASGSAVSDSDSASVTLATTSSASAPAITSAPEPSATQEFFTEYQTKSGEVLQVLWMEEVVTVTATETAAAQRKRHVHKHRRAGF